MDSDGECDPRGTMFSHTWINPIGLFYPGKWTQWISSSRCTKTCGGGQKRRLRLCMGPGVCRGDRLSFVACNVKHCHSKYTIASQIPNIITSLVTCENEGNPSPSETPSRSGPFMIPRLSETKLAAVMLSILHYIYIAFRLYYWCLHQQTACNSS